MSLDERYDAMPYVSLPYPGCHPDMMAVVAHLAGMDLAPPSGWRMLDLGCGDGGNLLAIAAALPGATCVGLDANAAAIGRGQSLAAAAGLEVELRVGDLTALPDDLGSFDAIMVHGVWSWGGDRVRAALPAAVERLLAPDGLLYVSYLAAPGAHLLAPAREVARRWAARESTPEGQVAAVRRSLKELLEITGGDSGGVYRSLLALEAERWDTRPDFLLFHDILDPDASAYALEDLERDLGAAGLTWLGEARSEAWWRWRLDEPEAERLLALAEGSLALAQQHYDDATGPVFKASVFARAGRVPTEPADAERALTLHIASIPAKERPELEAGDELTLLEALSPEPVPVAAAAAATGLTAAAGARAALRLAARAAVTLTLVPPAWTLQPGPRPMATGLARAQARGVPRASSLRHRAVELQHDAIRALLLLLDGTRTADELADALVAASGQGEAARAELTAFVGPGLGLLGRMALLLPPEPAAAA